MLTPPFPLLWMGTSLALFTSCQSQMQHIISTFTTISVQASFLGLTAHILVTISNVHLLAEEPRGINPCFTSTDQYHVLPRNTKQPHSSIQHSPLHCEGLPHTAQKTAQLAGRHGTVSRYLKMNTNK